MVDEVIPGKDLAKQGGTFLALGKGFLWGFRVFGGSLGFGGRGKGTLSKGHLCHWSNKRGEATSDLF